MSFCKYVPLKNTQKMCSLRYLLEWLNKEIKWNYKIERTKWKQVKLHNYIKVFNGDKLFQFMYKQRSPQMNIKVSYKVNLLYL